MNFLFSGTFQSPQGEYQVRRVRNALHKTHKQIVNHGDLAIENITVNILLWGREDVIRG